MGKDGSSWAGGAVLKKGAWKASPRRTFQHRPQGGRASHAEPGEGLLGWSQHPGGRPRCKGSLAITESLTISFCLFLTCYCTPTMHRSSSQTASPSRHSCLHVNQGSQDRLTCRQGPEPLTGRLLSVLALRCAPEPIHLRARGPWGLGLGA